MRIEWIKHDPEESPYHFKISYVTWWGTHKIEYGILRPYIWDNRVYWASTGKLIQYNQDILSLWCKSLIK